MFGCGVDLILIKRFEKILDSPTGIRFLQRVCTSSELRLIQSLKNVEKKAEKLAGIFGLKEAFSKAVGTGIGKSLSFKELEVTYLKSKKPVLKYKGSKKSWRALKVEASISHDGGSLIALVIVASSK